MSAYDDKIAALSRAPIDLAIITLDYCSNTYGQSPCTASGSAGYECYNTFYTCQDKANFTKSSKDYLISTEGKTPPSDTCRPYLKKIKYYPTEILGKSTGSSPKLTANGRATITVGDELDLDIGIDPYVATRLSAAQGEFWKKLLIRNPNFKGRSVVTKKGFEDIDISEFKQRVTAQIRNIQVLSNDDLQIDIADHMASMDDVEIPAKIDVELVSGITAGDTEIIVTDLSDIDTNYIKIEDEIIYYSGTVPAQNKLTGCTRGMFGTTAAAHSANTAVHLVKYFEPASGFTHLKTIAVTESGIASTFWDQTAFDYWKTWPNEDINLSFPVTEPTKASDLFWWLADLLDLVVWMNEDQKITCRRLMANEPGRSVPHLTNENSFVEESVKVDLNAVSRATRIIIGWDKTPLDEPEKWNSYKTFEVAYDDAAEGPNDNNGKIEQKLLCPWVRHGYLPDEDVETYMARKARRRLHIRKDPLPIISFRLELKDESVKTGDIVKVSTPKLVEKDGSPKTALFMITRREPKGLQDIDYKAMMLPQRKIGFIAPNSTPDYSSATEADKEYGFISNNNGCMDTLNTIQGYHIW